MYRTRRGLSGIRLGTEYEFRTREDPPERQLYSRVEPAFLPPRFVEFRDAVQIRIVNRSTISVINKGRKDLARAGRLTRGAVGTTYKNTAAAGRIARAGRAQRSGDRKRLDVRPTAPIEVVDGTAKEGLQARGSRHLRIL